MDSILTTFDEHDDRDGELRFLFTLASFWEAKANMTCKYTTYISWCYMAVEFSIGSES